MKIINIEVNDSIIAKNIYDTHTKITKNLNTNLKIPTGNVKSILLNFDFITPNAEQDGLNLFATFKHDKRDESFEVEITEVEAEGKTYNKACFIPEEILRKKGKVTLGIYGYILNEDETIKKRISLVPLANNVVTGSYDENAMSPHVPTPTVFEVYFQKIKDIENELEEYQQNYINFTNQYNSKPYHFNSIDEMKNGKLKDGDCAIALGHYNANDGGGATYLIRAKSDEDIEDNKTIIFLSNGLVAKKIKDNILRFHAVAKSFATYIVEFPNGKKMLVDTGEDTQWENIKESVDSLGITKFDYLIITHCHGDHVGNIQNFIDNYDFSECICWVGMKPDYINHSSQINDGESGYDDVINLLKNNNLIPVVPTNDSYIEIDKDTKLHFLNTDSEIAENFYDYITEYYTDGVSFNHFSLITEIMHKNTVITLTGDIERIVEKHYTDYMSKCNLMTLPHHGCNRDGYKPFYYATKPEYAIYNASKVILNHFKPLMYVKELGSHIITSNIYQTEYTSVATNGLFSFVSNGYSLISNVKGSGLQEGIGDTPKMYNSLEQLINYTSQKELTISLDDICNNMIDGSTLRLLWLNSYNEKFNEIYNNLKSIFPKFGSGYFVELKVIKSPVRYHIKVYNPDLEFEAICNTPGTWNGKKGRGIIPSISTTETLIETLKQLPAGKYSITYFTDANSDVLYKSGAYTLDVNILSNDGTNIISFIMATLRSTSTYGDGRCLVASCFISTTSTPMYLWRKIS